MPDNIHPVIQLLAKRMESHPEEFFHPINRWSVVIDNIKMQARGEDFVEFEKALSKVRLDQIHEEVMDELLNGDERRQRELEQKKELERQRLLAAQQAAQQLYAVSGGGTGQTMALSSLANTITGDPYQLRASNVLNIGDESITADLIKKLKKVAGL